jgi:acetyl-CoA synthetase
LSDTPALLAEIQEHARRRHTTHAFPRVITYLTTLPKWASGGIRRFVRQTGRVTRRL